MSNCDHCGLSDSECHCYMYELEERIEILEDGLDSLTNVVNAIHEYLIKEEKKNERNSPPYNRIENAMD